VRARQRALDVPVLLLVGRELESPFLAGAVRQIQRALPGSDLRVLPADQHLALDTASAHVVAVVAEFLRAAPRSP
jgi:pimeloyl-ACP methyl ester carboxylesterase